jgi:undecaprenol kinase
MRRVKRDSVRSSELLPPGQARALISIPRAWRRRVQRTSSLAESFYHAMHGLTVAFQGERNLKIHSVMAAAAVVLAALLRFDPGSWALLFLAIGLVVTAELLNTAIERVVDMFCAGEFNALARDAKDVAAGAVVCASLTSLAIGAALYVPRLFSLLVSH